MKEPGLQHDCVPLGGCILSGEHVYPLAVKEKKGKSTLTVLLIHLSHDYLLVLGCGKSHDIFFHGKMWHDFPDDPKYLFLVIEVRNSIFNSNISVSCDWSQKFNFQFHILNTWHVIFHIRLLSIYWRTWSCWHSSQYPGWTVLFRIAGGTLLTRAVHRNQATCATVRQVRGQVIETLGSISSTSVILWDFQMLSVEILKSSFLKSSFLPWETEKDRETGIPDRVSLYHDNPL